MSSSWRMFIEKGWKRLSSHGSFVTTLKIMECLSIFFGWFGMWIFREIPFVPVERSLLDWLPLENLWRATWKFKLDQLIATNGQQRLTRHPSNLTKDSRLVVAKEQGPFEYPYRQEVNWSHKAAPTKNTTNWNLLQSWTSGPLRA